MGKYFGTDGIRGIANVDLDSSLAYRAGQAAAVVLAEHCYDRPLVYICTDTRVSSGMLESALISGLTSAGVDVLSLGVMPTPAAAYYAKDDSYAGVMISASHNPFEYNGIKFFDKNGYKLADEVEERIETLIDTGVPHKRGREIGTVYREPPVRKKYQDHLLYSIVGSRYEQPDFSGLKVLIDCAHGAAYQTAREVFPQLSLDLCNFLAVGPDGYNINRDCGSTDMKDLSYRVVEGGYDLGIAFDGDADRCLFVDERGRVLDGDIMLALLAQQEHRAGHLKENTLVTTVMSNYGLHVWARENGITLRTTAVGDRYVLEDMLIGDYSLGGENSGHVIFLRHSTTGDGQLTALKMLKLMAESRQPLSELAKLMTLYPQVLINVPVQRELKQSLFERADVQAAITEAENKLDGRGRVLVRPSGTENLVRVMMEGQDREMITAMAKSIAGLLAGL